MSARAGEPHIGLIIEGKADLHAVPILLRRHMHSSGEYRDILGKPIALHGVSNATKSDGIEGFIATAAYRPGCRGVLVVLDADDNCEAELGPELLARAQEKVAQPVVFALAGRDYEDWLYASAETLNIGDLPYRSGARGLNEIKKALKEQQTSYSKPLWQPRLTDRMDISLARSRNLSLSRMLNRFDGLVSLLDDV